METSAHLKFCPSVPPCRSTCNVPSPPPPLGSQCVSLPPANFYTCCLNKLYKNERDS